METNKKIFGFALISIIILIFVYRWNNQEPRLLIINVLNKELYDDCHIKGSINVPFDQLENYVNELDKNTHIVLYCSNYMCTASGAGVVMLNKLGFNNVWAYEAGMAEWFSNYKDLTEGNPKEAKYLTMLVAKPENNDNNGVQHITTEDLRNKIKKMLKINGF